MKTLLAVFSYALAAVSSLCGADFSTGDKVELVKDAPIYFKDAVLRIGKSGERFTVILYRQDAHKVYLSAQDALGKEIAVNVSDTELRKAGSEQTTAVVNGVPNQAGLPAEEALKRVQQPGLDPAKPAPEVFAPGKAGGKGANLGLKIVKDELIENGFFYSVKGTVYNPNDKPVKNVVIKYYIWKKWMGQDGHGSAIKETGGLVSSTIKFLPPKQSVEFTAESRNAPIMTRESGLLPAPLGDAELSAEWDQ